MADVTTAPMSDTLLDSGPLGVGRLTGPNGVRLWQFTVMDYSDNAQLTDDELVVMLAAIVRSVPNVVFAAALEAVGDDGEGENAS